MRKGATTPGGSPLGQDIRSIDGELGVDPNNPHNVSSGLDKWVEDHFIQLWLSGLLAGTGAEFLSGAGGAASTAGNTGSAAGAGVTGSTVPVTGALASGLAPSGAVGAATVGGSTLASTLASNPTLVNAGVGLFGNLFSAYMQSKALSDSTDKQVAGSKEALEYAKQKDAQDRADQLAAMRATYGQYVAQQARLAPYQSAGVAALGRINTGLGLNPKPMPALPAFPDFPNVQPTNQAVPRTQPMTPPSSNAAIQDVLTVKMRAPNGQVQDVPLSQRDHYRSLGAEILS